MVGSDRPAAFNRSLSSWRATRERCDCSGYWFPHRRGGGACEHSPRREYYLALRARMTKADAEALLWADKLELLPR